MTTCQSAQSKKSFVWGVVPIASAVIGFALLLLISLYIYKSGHFQIDSVAIGDLNLSAHAPKVGMKLAVANSAPILCVNYSGLPPAPIKVTVDGQELEVSNDWLLGRASAQPSALADGEHIFAIKSGQYDERWLVVVDTVPPKVSISHPVAGYKSNKNKITLQGTADQPGAVVTASIGEHSVTAQANEKGFFCLTLPTKRGLCTINWNVHDEAGNSVSGQRQFICDFEPPHVEPVIEQAPVTASNGKSYERIDVGPKDPYTIFISKDLTFDIKATDADSGVAQLDIYVDGVLRQSVDNTEFTVLKVEADGQMSQEVISAKSKESNSDLAEVTKTASTQKTLNYRYKLPTLYEGTHLVEVIVYDNFGLSTKRGITFGVNTTEKYGQAPLGLGAIGDDVAELQRRLALRGYLQEGYVKGKFDKKTKEAVMHLQAEANLGQDGIAGVLVTSALSTRLYVNLSQYSLVLVDEANNTRYYQVAIGVDEHPTPLGAYFISDMAKDPTWLPPNSEWAKDAKQIPPGPNNPLGTRWIGFGDSVGFHGTPYPDTVGTKASHGCMRMTIPDIEDLYERVNVGTQVCIFKGDEDDPILKHYWP